MKRVPFYLLALSIIFSGIAFAVPNDDSTGPEGVGSAGTSYFQIMFDATNGTNSNFTSREMSIERFNLADGWDFGDRTAYSCGWVEYFQGQDEKFELRFMLAGDYPNFAQINDKFGDELVDSTTLPDGRTLSQTCIEGPEGFATRGDLRWDGSDHFPHMIHPGDGLYFYQDGPDADSIPSKSEPMLDDQGDPVVFDLQQPNCAMLYWVPGDEPGEAWLWWDEDLPTFSHGEGEGDLGCGGGPLEPIALFHVRVRNPDPGIGYCTHSQHEESCFNVEPPPTPVELLAGRSVLMCPSGATPVVESTEPLVVVCA